MSSAIETVGLRDQNLETASSITPIIDYISDDDLLEITFNTYLKWISMMLTEVAKSQVVLGDSDIQNVKSTTQTMLYLLKKGSVSKKQTFLPHAVNKLLLTIEELSIQLGTGGKYFD